MLTPVLFVSVNQTFREDMDLAQLEACAAGNWDITVAKASAGEGQAKGGQRPGPRCARRT